MAIKEILQLGNPELYKISEDYTFEELGDACKTAKNLQDTLLNFRKKYNRGRAIAAPQIGIHKKLIFLQIDKPIIMINPKLSEFSGEIFELWDDCMSFPDIVVRVKRHKSCRIEFFDNNWDKQKLSLENNLSELIQHEYDHLLGILAIQRAIDNKSIAYRHQIDL